MSNCDITILTASKFLNAPVINWYIRQVHDEDRILKEALENQDLKVLRTSWDDSQFEWTKTKFILFRTIWDYFDRFDEFVPWLERVKLKTKIVNTYETIRWNLDKHYLEDLGQKGINVPPTLFIEPGDSRSLQELIAQTKWKEIILKPAVSGAGRHTYKFHREETDQYEATFSQLIQNKSMLLQEFQHRILTEGEVAHILIGGRFSHAVLKKAKPGDFRVQDDFGGTVHDYRPAKEEIEFAEKVLSTCDPLPVYARVDAIHDNTGKLCVSELELIEPELWFRKIPKAADQLAAEIKKIIG
jgi:glutathione synthase/RimK-type ligase-like ATP-grasp enzyme